MTELTPQFQTLRDLITANHILDHFKLTDGFGHISVRDPIDWSRFYMTGNTSPAFVSETSNLAHYNIFDGSPVIPGDPDSSTHPYSERFCHSAILKQYSGVNAVVHSHSKDVIVMGVSSVPMRAMYHMAGFLGESVPMFDIAEHYLEGEERYMLVNSDRLGSALASTFSTDTVEERELPDNSVVFQRGHGFTTWGESIPEAVYRAVYTQENAQIQMAATDFSVVALGEVRTTALTRREAEDCAVMDKGSVMRAWSYWKGLVERDPRYRNELLKGAETDVPVYRRTETNRMVPF